jgi:hypothetical protein
VATIEQGMRELEHRGACPPPRVETHPCRKWVTRCVLAAPTEAFTPCQLRGLLSLRRA